ncbi:unnamed protein product [Tuber aestivum]|uniref:Cyclin-D1-binding protein 1-like N-terminal domain-containing protein n=1 Tax=Tuber aestivum TaxID=59557 RepID=A0A292PYH4_9PEZI|nr:unnamed protein product [Tuber aestivum]
MALKPLASEIITLKSLISQTRPLLYVPVPPPPSSTTTAPTIAPYPLLKDLSTLLRAHSTNLSIALRPPNLLYPAASKSIQEITNLIPQYLPAIQALPEISSLRRCIIQRVEDLFTSIAHSFSDGEANRDRLSGTGAIWSSCDALIALEALGTYGIVAELVQSYEALISDAAGELRVWVVEVCEGEDEGFVDDTAREDSTLEFWERPIAVGGRREDVVVVRGLVEVALKKVRLLEILLGAIRKRRLAGEGVVAEGVLEEVVEKAKGVSEAVDDVGMGFYEDEVGEAVEAQRRFQGEAVKLIDLVSCRDGSVEDKYTKWFHNCREALSKEG